jgi:hypothetical protein
MHIRHTFGLNIKNEKSKLECAARNLGKLLAGGQNLGTTDEIGKGGFFNRTLTADIPVCSVQYINEHLILSIGRKIKIASLLF